MRWHTIEMGFQHAAQWIKQRRHAGVYVCKVCTPRARVVLPKEDACGVVGQAELVGAEMLRTLEITVISLHHEHTLLLAIRAT
jgi:hypothetical protein